ncbi:Inosine/uridine-preferring nucleoside hydrolase domain-containing protein [Zopfochytrium polystomum]|nr:Inosine/uridine-preferring nucleoside hydrolase domain-containing protein [Zopfochytrium polystomum]
MRQFIVDSDFGIDDASSIMAVASSPDVDLLALTVVDGNVPCAQGIVAAKRLLAVSNKTHVPVYPGATAPLVRGIQTKECWVGHGKDGFGNFSFRPEFESFKDRFLADEGKVTVHDKPAALALIDLVKANPSKITILAIGPLTNIALAISLDPDFLSRLDDLIVMGGCINARGEQQPRRRVMAKPPVTIVSWETTLDHGLNWAEYDAILDEMGGAETAQSVLWKGMTHFYESMGRQMFSNLTRGEDGGADGEEKKNGVVAAAAEGHHFAAHKLDSGRFILCDFYAAVVALNPKAMVHYHDWDAQVELAGRLSRGMLAFNWLFDEPNPNVRVAFSIDKSAVVDTLRHVIKQDKA